MGPQSTRGVRDTYLHLYSEPKKRRPQEEGMAAEPQLTAARGRAKHFIICDSCFWCASIITTKFVRSCPALPAKAAGWRACNLFAVDLAYLSRKGGVKRAYLVSKVVRHQADAHAVIDV